MGMGSDSSHRYRISIWGDENVLELGSGDTFIIFEHTKNHHCFRWILYHVNYVSIKKIKKREK